MANPLNPPEGQDPLDDPMLDALERSIVDPPASLDPLAAHDAPLIDDLSRTLDALEASIEDTPPIEPAPDAEQGLAERGIEMDEVLSDQETTPSLPAITREPTETAHSAWESFQTPSPPLEHGSSARTPPPNPPQLRLPRRGGGSGRRGRGLPSRHRNPGRARSGIVGGRGLLRYCPESKDLTERQQCESCTKFRHWPEGTDTPPRECWHDWQAMKNTFRPKDRDSDEEAN